MSPKHGDPALTHVAGFAAARKGSKPSAQPMNASTKRALKYLKYRSDTKEELSGDTDEPRKPLSGKDVGHERTGGGRFPFWKVPGREQASSQRQSRMGVARGRMGVARGVARGRRGGKVVLRGHRVSGWGDGQVCGWVGACTN